jgi:hypothetical protein
MPLSTSNPSFVPVLDGPATSSYEAPMPVADRRLPPLLPTPEMRQAKGRLEAVGEVPTRDAELLAMNGWLAPDGTLYSCGYRTHDPLCRALGFVHESALEQAGYCKLSQLEWLVSPRYCPRELTEAQWATIERWYERNGFPQAHFLKLASRP